mgnify:FL=1
MKFHEQMYNRIFQVYNEAWHTPNDGKLNESIIEAARQQDIANATTDDEKSIIRL